MVDTNQIFKKGVLKNKKYTLKPLETRIKLNQNESPFDLPDDLKDKILSQLKEKNWNTYPLFLPQKLYQLTADIFGIKPENILLGNGSNEMIFTILAAAVDENIQVNIPVPIFTVYQL
ncbi:MAG: aminotransferase class I/II-fold pyridoxal phosphate-dependent enzyme, partial [Spirochaetes bacterium]|nr:aminotransferase class I/II-fold pyridoxal phosphate-dependent enzyme [Spirochaetota bacterium]